MSNKDYFFSLKRFIIIAVAIFFIFIFLGYVSAENSPKEAEKIIIQMGQTYKPLMDKSPLYQSVFIFLNNGFVIFLTIAFSVVFGVSPILSLVLNGAILGIVAFVSVGTISLGKFFLGVVPHGIIELPAMAVGCAIGLRIGKSVFDKIFKRKIVGIKSEISLGLNFFLKVLLPLLALAAIIEAFITTKMVGI